MADGPAGDGFDALLDATSDGVVILDADGTIVDVNEQFLALLDADRDAVAGATWPSLFADAPDLTVLQADDGRLEATLEVTDRDDDDAVDCGQDAVAERTPVSVACRRAGEHVVATVADRTASEERDRFERILESVDDGIYMLDAQGRIEYVNQAALDAHDLDYDREDIVGEFATAAIPAEDVEACVEAIQSLIADADARSEQVTVTVEDTDGTEVPAELNLSLLPALDGGYAGSVGVLRDVTERRRRDQMLRVLNRVLRHNLRNDMNVVDGYARDLAARLDGDDADTANAIARVAGGLVELSHKARTVEAIMALEDTNSRPLDSVVAGVVDDLTEGHRGVTVDVDVPSVPVARAAVVTAVVGNVVENAVEHGGDAPTITIEGTREDEVVELVVADDGPGIPEVELAAIRQGEESALEHGSGLGLWIVAWGVERLGGDLDIDVTGGTTVRLSLPVAGGHRDPDRSDNWSGGDSL